ncbi:hypothetical protein L1987_47834 [Smallanthus sonchifolius]|uniref:Uncharacterized protein n=1 Tax=Smallanthus sonchifolius TaxID=185202 RepID=A0ACB9FPU7_9ASTR|nr:hypothetical protein L1987_47834 [Smallanthus sonchifolius]
MVNMPATLTGCHPMYSDPLCLPDSPSIVEEPMIDIDLEAALFLMFGCCPVFYHSPVTIRGIFWAVFLVFKLPNCLRSSLRNAYLQAKANMRKAAQEKCRFHATEFFSDHTI